VENVAGNGISLFWKFCRFMTFEIIQRNVQLCIAKCTSEKNRVFGGSVKIIAVSEIYIVSVSIYF
jgi:hypothetical protein